MENATINFDRLYTACNRNGWFTEGTNEQYKKLFYASDMGCPIEELATIIWLCSDDEIICRRDIIEKLRPLMNHPHTDLASVNGRSQINTVKIRQLMAGCGLSITDLARRTGLQRQNLGIILQKGTCFTKTAAKIANTLNVNLADILSKEGDAEQ